MSEKNKVLAVNVSSWLNGSIQNYWVGSTSYGKIKNKERTEGMTEISLLITFSRNEMQLNTEAPGQDFLWEKKKTMKNVFIAACLDVEWEH